MAPTDYWTISPLMRVLVDLHHALWSNIIDQIPKTWLITSLMQDLMLHVSMLELRQYKNGYKILQEWFRHLISRTFFEMNSFYNSFFNKCPNRTNAFIIYMFKVFKHPDKYLDRLSDEFELKKKVTRFLSYSLYSFLFFRGVNL